MSKVFKISEAASLAIHAMTLLAQQPEQLFSTHDLSGMLNASEAHLSKVLQRLSRADLVNSIRGPKGGFRLARPASDINLKDVYEAMEGPLTDSTCLFSAPVCNGLCILGSLLARVNQEIKTYFTETKLSAIKDGIFAFQCEEAKGKKG